MEVEDVEDMAVAGAQATQQTVSMTRTPNLVGGVTITLLITVSGPSPVPAQTESNLMTAAQPDW